jgi:UDP-glucose 4-epimerase
LKKTLLISGIKGFLAKRLVALLKEDYTIIGIGKNNEIVDGIKVFESSKIEQLQCNIDFVIICHAAVASGTTSPSTKLLYEVNVEVTKRIVDTFSNSKIIYISSASIYDINTKLIEEESPINPMSEYAISKLWGEQIVLKSKNAVVFRLSSMFGIGMKENTIIPNYVNQALKNRVIEVWGKGERKQNYILVSDACLYIKQVLQNFDVIKGEVLLAVHPIAYSNLELAQIIAKETNSEVVHCNDDDSKSLLYNNEVTCKLVNWSPQSNFKEEIHKYIQWKKEQF